MQALCVFPYQQKKGKEGKNQLEENVAGDSEWGVPVGIPVSSFQRLQSFCSVTVAIQRRTLFSEARHHDPHDYSSGSVAYASNISMLTAPLYPMIATLSWRRHSSMDSISVSSLLTCKYWDVYIELLLYVVTWVASLGTDCRTIVISGWFDSNISFCSFGRQPQHWCRILEIFLPQNIKP